MAFRCSSLARAGLAASKSATRTSLSRRAYASAAYAPRYFPDEPATPSVVTSSIPGPKVKAGIASLNEIWDAAAANLLCDYVNSKGNYLKDVDGNTYLDVYAQIASIAVGYNNPLLRDFLEKSEKLKTHLLNRPAMGNFPSADWEETLKEGLMKVAPKGQTHVFTALSGSDANETAYKAAFMYVASQRRGNHENFSDHEIASSMENKAPGSPPLTILSFRKAFHGRLFGSLSTTRSKPVHKLDIPAFDWPVADFPSLQHPLEANAAENAKEEQRCLDQVESIISDYSKNVAAVVVEPIQSEGGDNHASPAFFRGLREITKKHGVVFIVDEVQTGLGATGKLWAHDHWELPAGSEPDIVTSSKKLQTGAWYYSNPALRPRTAYRQFNTWLGDPVRAVLLSGLLDVVEKWDLISNTAATGAHLYSNLETLSKKYPTHFQYLRGKGQGTFIAWDSPQRDKFLAKMKLAGVNIGGSGAEAVRLRPMLVFQKEHADLLAERIEGVVRDM